MKRGTNFSVLGRSIAIVASVIFLASGVTYAALQSPPIKLTGNTIETATANLSLSQNGNVFGSSIVGFDYNNLIPGGSPVPIDGNSIWLRNTGSTPINLKLSISSIPLNPNNVDLSKVNVILTAVGNTSGSPQIFSLESLIAANSTGGSPILVPTQLFAGNTQQYTIKVSMALDAITSTTATLSNIDFAFTGLAVSN